MFSSCRSSAIAVSIAIAFSAFVLATPGHSTRNHGKGTKQLNKNLARIRGAKGVARKELRATKLKAHVVKHDIMSVDNQLVSVKDNLDSTRAELAAAKIERAKAAENLKQSTAQLSRTRRLVGQRIKHIYMQGPQSGISALTGTQTAGDIASHSSLMRVIEDKDRAVFNRYIALQRQVAAEKRSKDEVVVHVASLEDIQEAQTRQLAQTRQEKAELLDNLRQKQSDLEATLRQFQIDESKITSEIEAYERAERSRRSTPGYAPLGAFSGRFSRPVNAPITSTFGMRYHPILHRVRMHEGVDFGASWGTPIHAAADGVVIFSSYMRGYGHVVILSHGGGYSTVYAHTSNVYCSNGQHVRRGQVIAAVGATGLATGPHLHFEVRVNGHPVDPLGHL